MILQRGDRLGRYEVLEPIGTGGMGEVYRAHDTSLGKNIAIKIVSNGFADDPTAMPRFAMERRIGAGLEHPHICRLLDAGQEGAISYLAMEYLSGDTLAARLQRGPVPLQDALGFAIEIGEALSYAHDQGVIHCDLKPANIFITTSGIKVLDFGLAMLRRPRTATPITGDTVPLAPSRARVMGTAMYTAPERLAGDGADHRTDIFAFGAVLYELLARRPAFHPGVDGGVSAVLTSEPPPMNVPGPRASDLEWLVRRCLAKQPERRWQSMHDIVALLKRIASGHGAEPGPDSRSRLAIAAAVLVLVATLAAVAAGAGWLTSTAAPADTVAPLAFTIDPPDEGFFTPTEGSVQTPQLALSPDGRSIAFVATGRDGVSQVWIRPLDTLNAVPLRGTAGATYPFWSPDGASLAFFADGVLKRLDISGGGPPRVLADAPHGRGGTWSGQGTILFAPSTTGVIRRVSASGGDAADVTHLAPGRGETSHRWPFFLPDGRRFLFFARSPQQNGEGLYLGALDSTEVAFVAASGFGGGFAPPDRVLFLSNGTLLVQTIDLDSGRPVGDPAAIAENVAGSSNFYAAFSVAPSGVLAFGRSGDESELVWMDPSGRRLETKARGQFVDFRLSADGRLLAVAEVDRDSGLSDVFVLDLERDARARLTAERATDASPLWSADGRTVLFRSNRERVHDLYLQSRGETGSERLLLRSGVGKYPTSWSRDGRRVLFHTRDERTEYDIWAAEVGPQVNAHPLVNGRFNEVQGQFSPDGRLIAYASDETSIFETYVQPAEGPGPRWQISAGGGMDPHWSADGREIFYISPEGWLMRAAVQGESEPEAPRRLFRLPVRGNIGGPFSSMYDVAPDGTRFLVRMPLDDLRSNPLTVLVNWRQVPRGSAVASTLR